MAEVEIDNNNLVIHYHLKDSLHQLDAKTFNANQANIISIIENIIQALDADVKIDVIARNEGGLKDIFQFVLINKSSIAIAFSTAVILPLILNISTHFLTKNPEKEKLEIEDLRLSIELKKSAIETSQLETEIKKKELEQITAITNNLPSLNNQKVVSKIKKKQSDLFKAMKEDSTIEKFSIEKETKKSTEVLAVVERQNFDNLILEKPEKFTEIDEDATIEIISPVLNRRKFKWRGIYNSQDIDFTMSDKAFKEKILKENLQFGTNNILSAKMEMKVFVDDNGEDTVSDYKVLEVYGTETREGFFEMPKKSKQTENKDEDQYDLFGMENN